MPDLIRHATALPHECCKKCPCWNAMKDLLDEIHHLRNKLKQVSIVLMMHSRDFGAESEKPFPSQFSPPRDLQQQILKQPQPLSNHEDQAGDDISPRRRQILHQENIQERLDELQPHL